MEFSPQVKFICSHCQESFSLSSDSTHSIAFCPHCSQELLIAELETKVGSTLHDQPESSIPAIQNIGRDYEILDLLGRGGMGAVYKARQTSLDREVAIKILPPSLSEESHFVQRFQRESETMAALDHPGIVKVLDRGKEGDLYYFVMEYVEGKSLQEVLKEEKLPWKKSCEILIKILQGLEYAHEKGVVHRDIKPGNILMGKDDSLKISDFGLARLLAGSSVAKKETLTDLTATEMVLGTLRYMAPEQRASSKGVDQRVDLFALGVMAYEMFTAKEPSGRFALPCQIDPDLPIGLDSFIEKALQPDPKDRFSRASEMVEKLRDLLEGKEDPLEKKALEVSKEGKSKREIMVKFLLGSQLGCSIAVTLSLAFILLLPNWSKLYRGDKAETAMIKKEKSPSDKGKREHKPSEEAGRGKTNSDSGSGVRKPLTSSSDKYPQGPPPDSKKNVEDKKKRLPVLDLLEKASLALTRQTQEIGPRRGRPGFLRYRELLSKNSTHGGAWAAREEDLKDDQSKPIPSMDFLLKDKILLKRIGWVKKAESLFPGKAQGGEGEWGWKRVFFFGMAFQERYLSSAPLQGDVPLEWAHRCYQKAIEIQPEISEPYYLKAFLYSDQGDFQKYSEYLLWGLSLNGKGYERALQWYRELKGR